MTFAFHLDRGGSALAPPSHRKLDELFGSLPRFNAVGGDNLHVLWLRGKRNPISAFMNLPLKKQAAKPSSPHLLVPYRVLPLQTILLNHSRLF